MRALIGAIIAAGSFIGLGLAAIGLGTRYTTYAVHPAGGGPVDFASSQVKFQDLDNPMKLVLILLVIGVVVGIATAFIGLMYHHHRRHHELLRLHGEHAGAGPRATV
jgi:hypothetical protein